MRPTPTIFMVQKRRKQSRKKSPPVQPPVDLDQNIEQAAAVRDASKRRAKVAPEVLPPSPVAIVPTSPPDVQPPGRLFTFEKMLSDLKTLELMSGPQVRDVLEKQLNLLGLNVNQAAIETLKYLADGSISEIMRSEHIKRLSGIGQFADAVSRQRMALAKSDFMPDRSAVEEKDPADMPLAEWEKKFGARMFLPQGKPA